MHVVGETVTPPVRRGKVLLARQISVSGGATHFCLLFTNSSGSATCAVLIATRMSTGVPQLVPDARRKSPYGWKVPVTGCLLTMVIAFLAASVLVALLATKDPAGNITISHQAVGARLRFFDLDGVDKRFAVKEAGNSRQRRSARLSRRSA